MTSAGFQENISAPLGPRDEIALPGLENHTTILPPPPPLRKHQEGQESDGQTGSWCLDIIRRWPSPPVSHRQEINVLVLVLVLRQGGAWTGCT